MLELLHQLGFQSWPTWGTHIPVDSSFAYVICCPESAPPKRGRGKTKGWHTQFMTGTASCKCQCNSQLQWQLAFLISIYKWLPFREPFAGFGGSLGTRVLTVGQVELLICHPKVFAEAQPNVYTYQGSGIYGNRSAFKMR